MTGIIYNWLKKLNSTESREAEQFSENMLDRLLNGPENDNMIVARAMPSSNLFTRWIIVYKRKTADIRDEYFKLRYTVQDFELPNSNTRNDTVEKVHKKTWYLRKEEEIYELLNRIGVSPKNFNLPLRCNYPLL